LQGTKTERNTQNLGKEITPKNADSLFGSNFKAVLAYSTQVSPTHQTEKTLRH
jgi:hypothetical protein